MTLNELIKESQQEIDKSLDEIFEKEGLKEKYLLELEQDPLKQNPKEAIENTLKAVKTAFHNLVASEQEIADIDLGLTLMAEHIFALPKTEAIAKNFHAAIARLKEPVKEGELPLYENWQEWLRLEPETLQYIYSLAKKYYDDFETVKARALFLILTYCNTFVFEPWFGLGLCYEESKQYLNAFHAFSMAAIANPNQPATYLHCAQCCLNTLERPNTYIYLEYAKEKKEFWTEADEAMYQDIVKLI